MNKNTINFIVDFVLFILLSVNIISVFMESIKFHALSGIALAILVIIHLGLHWSWIETTFKNILIIKKKL